MYVIVETGGKQYRLSKNDTFEAELINGAPGKAVKLDNVLLYSDGKKVEVGKPYLKSVKVDCQILGNMRSKKTISFKYKRRKDSRRKIGHRQNLTRLRVKDIKID
ncbi:MAG: 50S ribosomal protein L21 [Candidatus Omnitrophica bacterium]|nr:50S ribosomal protein L21 [Candidatus Omnitrophota bacterium]